MICRCELLVEWFLLSQCLLADYKQETSDYSLSERSNDWIRLFLIL